MVKQILSLNYNNHSDDSEDLNILVQLGLSDFINDIRSQLVDYVG